MQTQTEPADALGRARELFIRHHARYEVSQYMVVLDDRTVGAPPTQRRILAGFDLDVYASQTDHASAVSFHDVDLRKTLDDLCAACRETIAQAGESSTIEIIPFNSSLVLNVQSHFEPEALVRIRISPSGGLDQPAGRNEDKARADVEARLHALGVKHT
jgi:hypothetical protein